MTRSDRIVTSRHGLPLIFAAGLLAVSVAVAIVAMTRLAAATAEMNHSYDVIIALNRVVAGVRQAETEQRGFIITSQPVFIGRFERAAEDLRDYVTQAARLLGDDHAQAERFAAMRLLVSDRLRELQAALEIHRAGNLSETRDFIQQQAGAQTTMSIRRVGDEIIRDESRQMNARRSGMRRGLNAAIVTSSVTALVALGMAAHTFRLMRDAVRAFAREDHLIRAKENAERAEREKSEFLANMSHEIRTPLNAILGFADLLRGVTTSPKQQQYVESIRAGGRTLLALINDILDLSKIEAGRFEIIARPTSVRAVLESVRTIFAQQATERGIALRFEVEESVPPAVMFDGVRLRQILFNVVGNALKFTPQGEVAVAAAAEPSADDETRVTLRLRVADTGVGIAPEHQQLVFEPFRQARRGLDRKYGGTGLGLSITRRLVQMLGGRIELESRVGAGTEFRFVFPEVALTAAAPEEDLPPPADEDFRTLRPSLILVADDVPLNRDLITLHLEDSHHRLIHTQSWREAEEKARRFKPDVILVDAGLPDLTEGTTGSNFRRRERGGTTPVIAVASPEQISRDDQWRRRFDGVLERPVSRRALYRELARFLPAQGEEATPPTPAPEAAEPSASLAPADPDAWRTVVDQLRRLEAEAWPQVVGSMGFIETTEFARHVLELAEAADCEPARRYGRRLLEQLEAFEIAAVEETLRSFPSLVRQLNRTVESLHL